MAARLLGVLVLATLLAACSWDASEPGLFPRPGPSRSAVSFAPLPQPPPPPVNPALPVAGTSLWRTGDGSQVSIRFAVHAVRRMAGATVLDWSVTPTAAPGLRRGDNLPRSVDLGLTDETDANVAITLVDPPSGQAFRPLGRRSGADPSHCLCTPVWLASQQLRVGETRLLQVTYPPLPPGLATIDVVWPNSAPILRVPITPVGRTPTPAAAGDSDDPPSTGRAAGPVRFSIPGSRHHSVITLDRVLASDGLTALVWSLSSADNQRDLRGAALGPPVSTAVPDGVFTPHALALDGPVLREGRRELTARWTSSTVYGQPGYRCLCSSVGLWADGLWTAGGTVEVTTLYPGLTPAITAVDVELPGVTTLKNLPVRWTPPVPAGLDAPGDYATWSYSEDDPPRAWSVTDWPTPVPDPVQLNDYAGSVERLVPLPS